jgi:hypothetical protein
MEAFGYYSSEFGMTVQASYYNERYKRGGFKWFQQKSPRHVRLGLVLFWI